MVDRYSAMTVRAMNDQMIKSRFDKTKFSGLSKDYPVNIPDAKEWRKLSMKERKVRFEELYQIYLHIRLPQTYDEYENLRLLSIFLQNVGAAFATTQRRYAYHDLKRVIQS